MKRLLSFLALGLALAAPALFAGCGGDGSGNGSGSGSGIGGTETATVVGPIPTGTPLPPCPDSPRMPGRTCPTQVVPATPKRIIAGLKVNGGSVTVRGLLPLVSVSNLSFNLGLPLPPNKTTLVETPEGNPQLCMFLTSVGDEVSVQAALLGAGILLHGDKCEDECTVPCIVEEGDEVCPCEGDKCPVEGENGNVCLIDVNLLQSYFISGQVGGESLQMPAFRMFPECANGFDDDGNTEIDFGSEEGEESDENCIVFQDLSEAADCCDGLDNDGDGFADGLDGKCEASPDCPANKDPSQEGSADDVFGPGAASGQAGVDFVEVPGLGTGISIQIFPRGAADPPRAQVLGKPMLDEWFDVSQLAGQGECSETLVGAEEWTTFLSLLLNQVRGCSNIRTRACEGEDCSEELPPVCSETGKECDPELENPCPGTCGQDDLCEQTKLPCTLDSDCDEACVSEEERFGFVLVNAEAVVAAPTCDGMTCVGGTEDGKPCETDADCPPGPVEACEPLDQPTCSPGGVEGSVCDGGPMAGLTCLADRDCQPRRTAIWTTKGDDGDFDQECQASKCVGGDFDGAFCIVDSDCPGGTCPRGNDDPGACLPRFEEKGDENVFCRESLVKTCSESRALLCESVLDCPEGENCVSTGNEGVKLALPVEPATSVATQAERQCLLDAQGYDQEVADLIIGRQLEPGDFIVPVRLVMRISKDALVEGTDGTIPGSNPGILDGLIPRPTPAPLVPTFRIVDLNLTTGVAVTQTELLDGTTIRSCLYGKNEDSSVGFNEEVDLDIVLVGTAELPEEDPDFPKAIVEVTLDATFTQAIFGSDPGKIAVDGKDPSEERIEVKFSATVKESEVQFVKIANSSDEGTNELLVIDDVMIDGSDCFTRVSEYAEGGSCGGGVGARCEGHPVKNDCPLETGKFACVSVTFTASSLDCDDATGVLVIINNSNNAKPKARVELQGDVLIPGIAAELPPFGNLNSEQTPVEVTKVLEIENTGEEGAKLRITDVSLIESNIKSTTVDTLRCFEKLPEEYKTGGGCALCGRLVDPCKLEMGEKACVAVTFLANPGCEYLGMNDRTPTRDQIIKIQSNAYTGEDPPQPEPEIEVPATARTLLPLITTDPPVGSEVDFGDVNAGDTVERFIRIDNDDGDEGRQCSGSLKTCESDDDCPVDETCMTVLSVLRVVDASVDGSCFELAYVEKEKKPEVAGCSLDGDTFSPSCTDTSVECSIAKGEIACLQVTFSGVPGCENNTSTLTMRSTAQNVVHDPSELTDSDLTLKGNALIPEIQTDPPPTTGLDFGVISLGSQSEPTPLPVSNSGDPGSVLELKKISSLDANCVSLGVGTGACVTPPECEDFTNLSNCKLTTSAGDTFCLDVTFIGNSGCNFDPPKPGIRIESFNADPLEVSVFVKAFVATATPTNTPTSTPTDTPTATPTDTPTAIPTDTPTVTHTATPTGSSTETPTNTPTATATDTPTSTPTGSSTDRPTVTPTDTPAETPTLGA